MARRLSPQGGPEPTSAALAKGSLLTALALFCPVVGWLIFAPAALVVFLGAGLFALRVPRWGIRALPRRVVLTKAVA